MTRRSSKHRTMKGRAVAFLAVSLLLTTACGARLTEEQWDLVLSGQTSGAEGGTGTLGTTVQGGGTGQPGTAGTEDQTVTTGGGGGGTTTGTTGTTGSGGGGGKGGKGGKGGGGGGSKGGQCSPQGSSDTGVTPNSITISNVADISGIQPGLFQSSQDAIKALVAYENSTGGVCGRNLQGIYLDTKQDVAGNRAATLEACQKSFAIVGSMSAFDHGGASSGQQCGIPEIPAITTSLQKVQASTVYPAYPNRPDYFISAEGNYIKEKFPQVISKAAIIWLAADVPRAAAASREKGLRASGFNFVYRQEVQPVEPNYAPYVFDMQRLGVQYVTMIGNFQSIARLLDAMRQQQWSPTVKDFDSVVYDPDFLTDAGPAADGSLFFINTAMFEEAGGNQEMQLYTQWLSRTVPGAKPDYFGLYAWSAGRLFVQLMEGLGPAPTRQALLGELGKLHAWGGNGMHAEHDIGAKISSPCLLYGTIGGGKFTRRDPASGWMCDKGPVIKV